MKEFVMWFGTMLTIAVLSAVLGAGMEYDHDRYETGFAFGCGRFYADNRDPALDAADDQSPCYPYYKEWIAQETGPKPR